MNESDLCDAALAELLTLTVEVDDRGNTTYRNQQGKCHRVHGPAIIYSDGTKGWLQNDLMHRTDGPAAIYPNGFRFWYQNGLRHRTDGPAVIFSTNEWWYLNDQELTEEQYNGRVKSL